MTSIIPVSVPATGTLPQFRIEQSVNGHLMTPWFSFPGNTPWMDYRNNYHRIVNAAKDAFAEQIKMPPHERDHGGLMVSQKHEPHDGSEWFRISTVKPYPMLKKKTPAPENAGAIEI